MHRNLILSPIKPPCKDCGRRGSCGHKDCAKYDAYRAALEEYREWKHKKKTAHMPTAGMEAIRAEYDDCERRGRLHY